MGDKNIQMKNNNGNSWDNLFPITLTGNVFNNEGQSIDFLNTTLNKNINDLETNMNKNINDLETNMNKNINDLETNMNNELSNMVKHRPIHIGYDELPSTSLKDGEVYLKIGEPVNPIEEGTFNPNFISSNGPVNFIHGNRQGNYLKIGNMVVVTLSIELTHKGNANDEGDVYIENLPFTPKYEQMVNVGEVRGYDDLLTMPPQAIQLHPNFINNRGNLYGQIRIGSSDNTNVTNMRVPQINSNFRIITTFTYVI